MGESSSKFAGTHEEAQKQALAQISALLGSREALEALCHDLVDRECVHEGGGVSRAGLRTLTRLVVDSCHVSDPVALQELLDVLAPLPGGKSNGQDSAVDGPRLGYEGFICYARCVLRVVDAALQAENQAQKKDPQERHCRSPSFDGTAEGYAGVLAAISEEAADAAAAGTTGTKDAPVWPGISPADPGTPVCRQLLKSPLEAPLSPLVMAQSADRTLTTTLTNGSCKGDATEGTSAQVNTLSDQQHASSPLTSLSRYPGGGMSGSPHMCGVIANGHDPTAPARGSVASDITTAGVLAGVFPARSGAGSASSDVDASVSTDDPVPLEEELKVKFLDLLKTDYLQVEDANGTERLTSSLRRRKAEQAKEDTLSRIRSLLDGGAAEEEIVASVRTLLRQKESLSGKDQQAVSPRGSVCTAWSSPASNSIAAVHPSVQVRGGSLTVSETQPLVRARSVSPAPPLACGPHRLAGRHGATTLVRHSLTPPPATPQPQPQAQFVHREFAAQPAGLPRASHPPAPWMHVVAALAARAPPNAVLSAGSCAPALRSVTPCLATPRRSMRRSMPAFGSTHHEESKETDLPMRRSPLRTSRSTEPREGSLENSGRGRSVHCGTAVDHAPVLVGTEGPRRSVSPPRRSVSPPVMIGSSLVARSTFGGALGAALDPASSASSSSVWRFPSSVIIRGDSRSLSPPSACGSSSAPVLSAPPPGWSSRTGATTPEFQDSGSPVPQPLWTQQASASSARSLPPTRKVSPHPLLPPPRISGGGAAVVRGFRGPPRTNLADEHAADNGGAAAALNEAVRRSAGQKPPSLGSSLNSSVSLGSLCINAGMPVAPPTERIHSGQLRRSCSPSRLPSAPAHERYVHSRMSTDELLRRQVPTMVTPSLFSSAVGSASASSAPVGIMPVQQPLSGLLQPASARELSPQQASLAYHTSAEEVTGLEAVAAGLKSALASREHSCEGQLKSPAAPQSEASTLSWPCADGADFSSRSRHVRFEEPASAATSTFGSPSVENALLTDGRCHTGPASFGLQSEAVVSFNLPNASPSKGTADSSTPLSCLAASPPALITPSPKAQEVGQEVKAQGIEHRSSLIPVFSPPRLCTPRPANGPAPMLCTPVRDAGLCTPTLVSDCQRLGDERLNGTSNAAATQENCAASSVPAGANASKDLDASSHSLGTVPDSMGALSESGDPLGLAEPAAQHAPNYAGTDGSASNGQDSIGIHNKLPRDVPEILRHHLEAVTVELQCE